MTPLVSVFTPIGETLYDVINLFICCSSGDGDRKGASFSLLNVRLYSFIAISELFTTGSVAVFGLVKTASWYSCSAIVSTGRNSN